MPIAGDEADFDWGLQSFVKEAKVLWQIQHPNIVRVLSYEEQGGTRYIVMEYVRGESLSQRLKQRVTLPEADIRQFVLPIMDGLAAVHDSGFLHLDVAPKNIVLTQGGRGILLDFGAARPTQLAATGESTTLVTPSYAALEQHVEAPQLPATDIYSLGAVLYRCVTGQPPWHPARRVENDRMPRAADAERRPAYSQRLLGMIDAALAVLPEDRPQSVADWQVLLSEPDESEAVSGGRAPEGSERSDHELAEEGDADAQYRLGLLYAEGDTVEARYWFRMAAGQAHPRAQYRLHRMYEYGEGGVQDRSAAAEWEAKAWRTDANAQCRLAATCRQAGDEEEAEFWYRGAARHGHVDAQYELGALYWDRWLEGKIVDAAVEVSLAWCAQRVADGSTWAGVFLAGAIDVGIADGHREFRDAEAEMRRLLKEPSTAEARESGNPADAVWDADCATFCLAYKYLRMAARQGHPQARESCDELGVFMLKHALDDRGWHHAFLTDLALETMTNRDAPVRCRVEDGEILDRFRLGGRVAYQTIRAGAAIGDCESAATGRLACSKEDIRPYLRCWLTAARELLPDRADAVASVDSEHVAGTEGNADYQYERGLRAHYEDDFEEAEYWYMQAADQDHAKAQFDLGMMYFHREIEGSEVGECVKHAVWYCMDAAANRLEWATAFRDRDIQSGLEAFRRRDHYAAELEFRRLAEFGRHRDSAEAQFRLAQMCIRNEIHGDYDDHDRFDSACRWLRRASRNGWGRAESWLYGLLGGGAGWWFNVDVGLEYLDELGDRYWKAREKPAVEQYGLGLCSEGDPDYADRGEASFWYRLAADQGHLNAQFRIGLLTYLGVDEWHSEGPSVDEDEGRTYWLRTAARNGHQIARALLDADPENPAGFGRQTSLLPTDLSFGSQTSLFPTDRSLRPNVAFPAFAEEMQAESEQCAREPRLLRALYRSYRGAAERAFVAWARDFSTDFEIDAWYDSPESSE